MEHHANFVPWQVLCEERGAVLRVAPIDDRGVLLLDEFEKLLSPRTRLAALDARLERARHREPGARDRAAVPRARRAAAGRRRAGGAAPARRRERARLRLLRVLGPQAVRPDRRRRAVGPRRAARGDAAVPDRRLDDRVGDASGHDLRRASRSASRPARPTSPRSSASAPRSTTSSGIGLDAIAAHERELLALRRGAARRGARACASSATRRTRPR